MKYTVHQAKTNLSKLLQEASAGKEVIIARGKQPVAKLVPIGSLKQRVPGRFQGQFRAAADAFDPLTDQELADMGLK